MSDIEVIYHENGEVEVRLPGHSPQPRLLPGQRMSIRISQRFDYYASLEDPTTRSLAAPAV